MLPPLNMAFVRILSYSWVVSLYLIHSNLMIPNTSLNHTKSYLVIVMLFWSSLIKSMLPSHLSCHLMFTGSYILNKSSYSITDLSSSCHPPLIWSIMLDQCPPSMIVFLLTSMHHLGVRLRIQLVPGNLHASMVGLLIFDSQSTSSAFDQNIPWVFDFNSFIHTHRSVLGYLGNHFHHWWFPLLLLMTFLKDW